MKKESSHIPLLSIAIFFFVVGAISVLLNLSDQNDQEIPNSASALDSNTSQRTALIIGVDRLDQTEPQLLSVWLAMFHFPSKEIVLSGFPTDFEATAASHPLSDLFMFNHETGVSGNFISAIQNFVGLEVDVVLVLDEVGFASLIDFLDGITLTGNYMDGPTVISALRVFYEDPLISLEAQGKVLRALANRVGTLGESPNLTPLFNLIPNHAYTSEPPSVIAVSFGLLLPLHSEAIQIQEWNTRDQK
jgi:anionic cell wall polymer biosynthesis LytR-Cps2A-Psr (LCP) family protein